MFLSLVFNQPDPGLEDVFIIETASEYNTSCTANIGIGLLNDEYVTGFILEFTYNDELLFIGDITKTTRLDHLWLIDWDDSELGIISVIGSTGVLIPGNGPILELHVSYPIDLEAFTSELSFTFGLASNEVSSWAPQLIDGSLSTIEYGYPLGDVNNDLEVDILDVVVFVEVILGNNLIIDYFVADINCDSAIDVLDIIGIVNIILT